MTTRPARAGFELVMRPGVHPARVVGKKVPPPPDHVELRESGMYIERNVSVHLRDGTRIFVDIYRPDGTAGLRDVPVLLGWSPYGKHNLSSRLAWPEAGVADGWMSRYTAFEAPDPVYWCGNGYAVVYPDPRGSWYSEGELRHGGVGESADCYDLIEWLGTRPWSNGKVGMSGVSYLTAMQWQAASLRPPHLAAINPWEGFTDWYREFCYHGGIPETSFVVRGSANLQYSTTRTEDTAANVRAHPLHDAYWASKEIELEAIEVPAYVVASWSDHGLHTRGTLEAYKRIASREKWLEVHGRKKWHYYYEPSRVEKQRQFFDRYLKQKPDTGVSSWPRVLVEVRERAHVGEFRAEREYPLARTQFRKLFLDTASGKLRDSAVIEPGAARYEMTGTTTRAVFDYAFDSDTELTGHMKLRLWVEALGADDMDLFVAIQKLEADGTYVPFVFYAMNEDGPAALGWLRASHRELDPVRSRPEQPFHPHTREERLRPGQPAAVEIEIWPSATLFRAGQQLRVVVQGSDVADHGIPNAPFARHEQTRNRGTHVIHAGGQYDSHLLVPVVPSAASPPATPE
jgi:predicted acyl esterase